MLRTRITTRRLMIVVAVLALSLKAILWVGEMRNRSADYCWRAVEFVQSTHRGGSFAATSDHGFVNLWDDENAIRHDAWAFQMAEKYRRLSLYPWLTPKPDPPPPTPLAHPKSAIAMPADDYQRLRHDPHSQPPVWTVLWTWSPFKFILTLGVGPR